MVILLIDKYKINFNLTSDPIKNNLFKNILDEILKFLYDNLNYKSIEGIILTGSIANGEGTIINNGEYTYISDFDILLSFNLLNFLKYRAYCIDLSQKMTQELLKKKIFTHVNYLPNNDTINRILNMKNTKIYDYEFRVSSKLMYGKQIFINDDLYPSTEDSFELLFTVLSHQLFNLENKYKVEKVYEYAKLSLTLLNSFLIYNNLIANTYKKRLNILIKNREIFNIITDCDINIFKIYTQFKIDGSLNTLMNNLNYINIDFLIDFQKKYLRELSLRILRYELYNINLTYKYKNNIENNYLLYILQNKFNIKHYLINILLYIINSIFLMDTNLYHKLYIVSRIPSKKIFNYYLIKLFILNDETTIYPLMSSINYSNIVPYINKFIYYWKYSESSIKF